MKSSKQIFLFLIHGGWKSLAGGIQTVNREICKALAKILNDSPLGIGVACLAEKASDDDIEDAALHKVELLAPTIIEKSRRDDRLIDYMYNNTLDNREVISVIGHSKFTGKAARVVRDRHFSSAKVSLFVHMDPEETENIKKKWSESSKAKNLINEREYRSDLEIQFALNSNFVFAMGPLLYSITDSNLSYEEAIDTNRPNIEMILGGASNKPIRKDPPKLPIVLSFGRTDSIQLKGVDIFAKACGLIIKEWNTKLTLKDRQEPRFIVRGARKEPEKLQSKLHSMAKNAGGIDEELTLIVKPYTTSEEELNRELIRASLVVMPSRSEGFGLVALEALSWGIPIIVSTRSGVGQLIVDKVPLAINSPCLLNVSGVEKSPEVILCENILYFLENPDTAKRIALSLRESMIEHCSWSNGAKSFLSKFVTADQLVPAKAHGPIAITKNLSTLKLGNLAEISPINERGENVVLRYFDGILYTETGRFIITLHIKIRALETIRLSKFSFKYYTKTASGERIYPILHMNLFINEKKILCDKDWKFRFPEQLTKGNTVNLRIDAFLLARMECEEYYAQDYGELMLTFEFDKEIFEVESALNPKGRLLLGKDKEKWSGWQEL